MSLSQRAFYRSTFEPIARVRSWVWLCGCGFITFSEGPLSECIQAHSKGCGFVGVASLLSEGPLSECIHKPIARGVALWAWLQYYHKLQTKIMIRNHFLECVEDLVLIKMTITPISLMQARQNLSHTHSYGHVHVGAGAWHITCVRTIPRNGMKGVLWIMC